jgi:chemotaxis methyl-accepting protein methylase
MTDPALAVPAARRHLEAAYGLALEGLGDHQIAGAIAAAGGGKADPADPAFLARLVDHLPIDESWLFREDALWEWLRDDAGPALLEAAALAHRPVRVLSLGCSSGQESFSVAILFQGLLERVGLPASAAASYVRVTGLDPSPARIEAARSGFLPAWSVQRCREDWLRGRVAADGEVPGRFQVDPAAAAMCRFEVGNLLDVVERGNAALGGFDLVLCRHVLIYFRPAEAERLAAGLARGLDRGALLAFSAAEAHLLEPAGIAPVAHLGAGRAGPEPPRAHRPGPRRTASAPAPRPTPPRGVPRPLGRRAEPADAPGARDDAIAAHIRVALEHAHAGRTADALREARAAVFHDPMHLYSRMLLGLHLIEVDSARGREVLRALLETASTLPGDAEVPCADGLSVRQLTEAVELLLARPEAH